MTWVAPNGEPQPLRGTWACAECGVTTEAVDPEDVERIGWVAVDSETVVCDNCKRGLMKMIEVRVPGAVYYECFDPNCTEFPREYPEIAKPAWRRVGKGHTLTYTVTLDQAEIMLDVAQDFGDAMSYGVDDPRAGRMVARWAERERARLAAALAADPRDKFDRAYDLGYADGLHGRPNWARGNAVDVEAEVNYEDGHRDGTFKRKVDPS